LAVGANGMSIMRKLGLEDVILREAEESEQSLRCFQFLSGYGDHELLFDVS
jgi:hypothetical protein